MNSVDPVSARRLIAIALCLISSPVFASAPVMTVGELEISDCELDWRFALKMPMAIFHRDVDGARKAALRDEVLDEIEHEALLALEARRLKIKTDLAELDALYMEALKKAGGQERAKKVLAQCGLDLKALRASLRRGLDAKALIGEKSRLADDEQERRARARYNSAKSDFTMPASLHLWQAIAKTDPGRIKQSRAEALPRAQKIAERLLAGDSLEQLKKSFAGDSFKDMGWVHESAVEKKYRAEFAALELGSVSDPLVSIYGYNMFKLVEKRPPKQLSYDEIKKAIQAKLRQQYRQEQRQVLLKQARLRYKIKRAEK